MDASAFPFSRPGYNRTMNDDLVTLRQKLARVFWLGGSPCSGKSSIADALVSRYNLRLYRCDEAFFLHNSETNLEKQPVFYSVMRLDCEGLWMRPVSQQVTEEIEIYREEFPLILRDLLEMPGDQAILAEGAALMPELIAPLLAPLLAAAGRCCASLRRAAWVVPTAEFQRYHYSRRDWAKQVVKDCQDPEKAFANWMERDIRFAEIIRREADQRELPVLLVDGAASIAENTAWVEKHFHLEEVS